MSSTRHRAERPLVVLALALAPGAAHAESPTAAAEALYQEGRRLLESGEIGRACGKLAQSQRLEPSGGTLMNLADCHDREGKTATAWAEFQAVEGQARAQGSTREADESERRMRALALRLSYVVLRATQPAPGMVIRLAGLTLGEDGLGSRLPVDPGEIDVSVEAPGRHTWSMRFLVAPGPSVQDLVIPVLNEPPRGDAAARVSPSKRRTPALVVGGVGVVALGLGSYFGLRSGATYRSADHACPTHTGCGAEAQAMRGRAGDQATVADIGFGIGLIALGVATYLWFSGSGTTNTAPVSGVSAHPGGVRVVFLSRAHSRALSGARRLREAPGLRDVHGGRWGRGGRRERRGRGHGDGRGSGSGSGRGSGSGSGSGRGSGSGSGSGSGNGRIRHGRSGYRRYRRHGQHGAPAVAEELLQRRQGR